MEREFSTLGNALQASAETHLSHKCAFSPRLNTTQLHLSLTASDHQPIVMSVIECMLLELLGEVPKSL